MAKVLYALCILYIYEQEVLEWAVRQYYRCTSNQIAV